MPRVNFDVKLILERKIKQDGSKWYFTKYMPYKGHEKELPSWQPESNFKDPWMLRLFDRYLDDPNKSDDWMAEYEEEFNSTYKIMKDRERKDKEEKERETERKKTEKEEKKEAKRNAILASLGTRSRSNTRLAASSETAATQRVDASPVTRGTTSPDDDNDSREESDDDEEGMGDDPPPDDDGEDDGGRRPTSPNPRSLLGYGVDNLVEGAPSGSITVTPFRLATDGGWIKASARTIASTKAIARHGAAAPFNNSGLDETMITFQMLDAHATSCSREGDRGAGSPSPTDPVLEDPFEFTEEDARPPADRSLASLWKKKVNSAGGVPQGASNQRRSRSEAKRVRGGEAAHLAMSDDEPQTSPGVKRNCRKIPRDDPMEGDQEIKEEVTDEVATAYIRDQKFTGTVPSSYGTRGSSEDREETQVATEREKELLEQVRELVNSDLRAQIRELEREKKKLNADLKMKDQQHQDLLQQTSVVLANRVVDKARINELRQRNEELAKELSKQTILLEEKHEEYQILIDLTNRRTFDPQKNEAADKAVLVDKLRKQIEEQDETIEKLTKSLEKASLDKSPPPPSSQGDMEVDKLAEEQSCHPGATDSIEAAGCPVNNTQEDKGEHRTYFSLTCDYGFPLPRINMSCNDCIKQKTKCRGSLAFLWQSTLQRLVYWSKNEMRIVSAVRRALPRIKPPTTALFSTQGNTSQKMWVQTPDDVREARLWLRKILEEARICPNAVAINRRPKCDGRCKNKNKPDVNDSDNSGHDSDQEDSDAPPPPPPTKDRKKKRLPRDENETEHCRGTDQTTQTDPPSQPQSEPPKSAPRNVMSSTCNSLSNADIRLNSAGPYVVASSSAASVQRGRSLSSGAVFPKGHRVVIVEAPRKPAGPSNRPTSSIKRGAAAASVASQIVPSGATGPPEPSPLFQLLQGQLKEE